MLPYTPNSGPDHLNKAGMDHNQPQSYHHGHGRTTSLTNTTATIRHNPHHSVGTASFRWEPSAAGYAGPESPSGPRMQSAASGGPSRPSTQAGWVHQQQQTNIPYTGATAGEGTAPVGIMQQLGTAGASPRSGDDEGRSVPGVQFKTAVLHIHNEPGHENTHVPGRGDIHHSSRAEGSTTPSNLSQPHHTQPQTQQHHEGHRAGVQWWNNCEPPWTGSQSRQRHENLPQNMNTQNPHNSQPHYLQQQQHLGTSAGMHRPSTSSSPLREMQSDLKPNGVSVRPLPSPAPSSPGHPGPGRYSSGDDPAGMSSSSAYFRGGNSSTPAAIRSAVEYPPVTAMTPPPPTGFNAQIRPEARPPEDRRTASFASTATGVGFVVGDRAPDQFENLNGMSRSRHNQQSSYSNIQELSSRSSTGDGRQSSRSGSFTDRRPVPISPATTPSHHVLSTGSVSHSPLQPKGFANLMSNNTSSITNSPTTVAYEAAQSPPQALSGASWKRLTNYVGFPDSSSPSPSSPGHKQLLQQSQTMDRNSSPLQDISAPEYHSVDSTLPPMMSRASLASSIGSASDTNSSSVTTTSTDTTITAVTIHHKKPRAGSLIGGGSISTPDMGNGKKEYRCTKKEGCNQSFSCNSLRKKHEMKHTKPFTCIHRGCPKYTVGFTTSNDLRRHMKALHGNVHRHLSSSSGTIKTHNSTTLSYSIRSSSSVSLSPAAASPTLKLLGDTENGAISLPQTPLLSQDQKTVVVVEVGGWRCIYCPDSSGSTSGAPNGSGNGGKGFFSTRKDNFRNHVKRIHSGLRREGESMDDFFKRSEVECRVDSPVLQPSTLTLAPGQLPLSPPPLEDEKPAVQAMEDTEMHMGHTTEGQSASATHYPPDYHSHHHSGHRYSRSTENAISPNTGMWPQQRLPSMTGSPRMPSGNSAVVSNITTTGTARASDVSGANQPTAADVSPRSTGSPSQWRPRPVAVAGDTSPRMQLPLSTAMPHQQTNPERNNSPHSFFTERRTSSWTAVNQHHQSTHSWGAVGSGGPRTTAVGPVGDRREGSHADTHQSAPSADYNTVANHGRSNSYSGYGTSTASIPGLSSPPSLRGVGGGQVGVTPGYAYNSGTSGVGNFNQNTPRAQVDDTEHEDVHKALRQLEDEERQAEQRLKEIREKKKSLLGRMQQRGHNQPQHYDSGSTNQQDIEMVDGPEHYALSYQPNSQTHRQHEPQRDKPKPERSGPARGGSLSHLLNHDDDEEQHPTSSYRAHTIHRSSHSSERMSLSATEGGSTSAYGFVPSATHASNNTPYASNRSPQAHSKNNWDNAAATSNEYSPIGSPIRNNSNAHHYFDIEGSRAQLQEPNNGNNSPGSRQRARQAHLQSLKSHKGATASHNLQQQTYKEFCSQCSASFRLPCQLRKHMKRHSKPFGCTHDNCSKVFGAKNDWKRHENSQHHQLECWKCDIVVPNAPGSENSTDQASICGKCSYRKADFVKHLKDVHGNKDGWIVDPNTAAVLSTTSPVSLEATLSTPPQPVLPIQTTTTGRDAQQIIRDCHIPKFHGGAFWCGFCRKVIKLDGKVGIEGWDKRFDHIADHFEKEGLRVSTRWLRLENPGESKADERASGAKAAQSKSSTGAKTATKETPNPSRKISSEKIMSSDLEEYEDVEDEEDPEEDEDAEEDDDEEMMDTTSDRLPTRAQATAAAIQELEAGRKYWDCCKCGYGPFILDLYESCTNCQHHEKCTFCRERWGTSVKQKDHILRESTEKEQKI